jgi:type I restriction enzyme, S subunit
MIPSGWQMRELRELAVVERGKFTARPRNDPKYYGGLVPFVQTGDVARSGGYLSTYSQTLNDAGLAISRLFARGTILVTIAANIGEVAILEIDAACPDSVVAIQPLPEVDTVWLAQAILAAKETLDGYANQNAQKNINLADLRPLPILTPPFQEQRSWPVCFRSWIAGFGC